MRLGTGTGSYYRLNFTSGTTNLDILRNHKYTFTITGINNPGANSAEAAYTANDTEGVSLAVTAEGNSETVVMSSYGYYLSISRKEFTFGNSAVTKPTNDASLLKIKTNYSGGWSTTAGSGNDCYLVNAAGTVISSGVKDAVSQTYIARKANATENDITNILTIKAGELSAVVNVTRTRVGGGSYVIYFDSDGTLQVGRYGVEDFSVNDMALFKFGSVVGFTLGSTETGFGLPPRIIKYNPSTKTITLYNDIPAYADADFSANRKNVSDPAYHSAANIRNGKGDPCKLVGKSAAEVLSLAQSGTAYDNGIWRLPTAVENAKFVGGPNTIWKTWAVGGADYSYSQGTGTGTTIANFFQATGGYYPLLWFPVIQGESPNTAVHPLTVKGTAVGESTLYTGAVSGYWSSTPQSNSKAYHLFLNGSAIFPVTFDVFSYGIHIRCVLQ